MKTRLFGNSSLYISPIGLGMAALGRPGYINLGHGEDLPSMEVARMKDHASNLLSEAYKLGIRYIDMARSYGKSEEFVAEWFTQNKELHNTVALGSKWGYEYTANWKVDTEVHEVKDHSLDLLQKQWKESQATLRRQPEIYHIHSATLESGVLENDEILAELEKMKKGGLVIGLSVSGQAQAAVINKALEVNKQRNNLFQSLQVTFNVLEQSSTDLLKQVADCGCGIIVKEAVANGRLTARNNEISDTGVIEQLQLLAHKYEVGLDTIALSYVLHQPWVSTVLSGAATVEQLRSNVKALDVQLTQDELQQLKSLSEDPGTYWKKRSALAWN